MLPEKAGASQARLGKIVKLRGLVAKLLVGLARGKPLTAPGPITQGILRIQKIDMIRSQFLSALLALLLEGIWMQFTD